MQMKSSVFAVAGAVALSVFTANAELRISEICPKPNSYDSQNRSPGWIEFYNDGAEALDLADYQLVRANRGKASASGDVSKNFVSRSVPAGGYTVVYTTEDWPNAQAGGSGLVEIYQESTYGGDMMVFPSKINNKKYPLVRLYKVTDTVTNLVDEVIVPVDLPERMSIAPVGSPFSSFSGANPDEYTVVSDASAVKFAMLPTTTKGAANNYTGAIPVGPNAGPLYGVAHKLSDWQAFPAPVAGEDYDVSLAVNPLTSAAEDEIVSVTLLYRCGTGATNTLALAKGASDATAGQLWTNAIPAAALPAAGQPVRWAAQITDAAGNTWRTPSFRDKQLSYGWYGTMMPAPTLESATLQTFHIFVEGNSVSQMDVDVDDQNLSLVPYNARCDIFDSSTGYYYDNVRIDLRGNTTAGDKFPKKSHGLRFNKSQPLTCTDPVTGTKVKEIRKTSFIAEYSDPAIVRQALSFKVFKDMGLDVPFDYPVRLNLNGQFYQLAWHSNRFTDELIEDYYGYDPFGYGFKSVGTLDGTSTANNKKKVTPDNDNETDVSKLNQFQNLISGVSSVSESFSGDGMDSEVPAVTKTVVQKFDLPAWVNYLAAARITQECDDVWANLCAYYDVNGTDTWKPLAYDLNLSWGAYYCEGGYNKNSYGPIATNDHFKSHPFYGGLRIRCHQNGSNSTIQKGNRGFESIWQSPKFRRLYLRRLRTLMDEQLKAPGTAKADTPFWSYVTMLQAACAADDALDNAKWGYGGGTVIYPWTKNNMSLQEGIDDLWDNYVVPRRTHLYVTHSVTNTAKAIGYGEAFNAGIPLPQSPISTLAPNFSFDNLNVEGSLDGDVLVIRNGNAEAVDMSDWTLSGTLNCTFAPGTVVDANDTITVVADRKAYVADNAALLTNQVIVGNARHNASVLTLALLDADGTPVAEAGPAVRTDNYQYLRLHSFDGVTTNAGGDTTEWIVLTNLSDSVALDLAGVHVVFCKTGDSAAKCDFTIGAGATIPAGGSIRLDQADYAASGWAKITNGNLDIAIYDEAGDTVQSGKVVQGDFAAYKKKPGEDPATAKYLVLNSTAHNFVSSDFAEECYFEQPEPEPEPEPSDGFKYRFVFTVNGYNGAPLTNFPVLVRLAADSPTGFSYADCAAGGADIVFQDDAGNEIPREIDTWNTAGESLIWVSVPVVTNGATFTMAYCNPAVTVQPACQTNGVVWSAAGYKGVWHMNSVDPADSTANRFNGTHRTTNLSVVNGAVGSALNIPHADNSDGVTCGSTLANSELTGGFTIEGWCRPTQYGGMGDGAAMFGKEGIVSLRINSATKVILTTPYKANHDINLSSGVLPAVNEWWHFVATFKMNTSKGLNFYVNGELKNSQDAKDINKKTETTEMFLGNNEWNQAFKGDLDEIRLSAGLRSTNWIAASYATQSAADFLAAGPRVGGAAPVFVNAMATPTYTNAQLSVMLLSVGDGATSASVSVAYGPEGGALSEPVVIAASATEGQTLTASLTGLAAGTTYRYVFTAENDLPVPLSSTEEGTFSTFALSAPTLSLSDRQESKESQTVGASVTDLGGGASCDLYFAYGPNGAPLSYSQVGTDLAAGATFSRLLEDLDVGTVYAYSFAVTNDLGMGTVETGTFTAGVGYLNPAHFAYRAKFTVTGYTGTEVLENFPALVRLAADSPLAFDYADCAEGGSDIRFADAEGNLIPHEIETWNTAGQSLIWVGLPTAANGTIFTMYYHSDAPGVPSTDDVWENYVAVVHGGSSIANAVAGGSAAMAGSAAVAANADSGKVGGGIRKSTANAIGVNVANPSSKLTSSGKFSVSAWFKRDGNGGKNNGTHVLGGSQSDWNSTGFLWLQEQGKYISIAAPGAHQWSSGSALPDGEWAHAAFTYESGKTLVGYYNGAAYQTKSGPGNLVNTSGVWTFGSYQNKASEDSYKGDMDELRIYNGVASADRIKAEYDTMAGGAFLTVGPSSASGNPQLSTSSLLVDLDAVNVVATVDSVGADASSCDLYFAYARAGDALPGWTLVASGLTDSASRTRNLTGLVEDEDYEYAFMASNNLGKTVVKSGIFTAGIGFKRPDPAVAEFSRGVKFIVTGYTGTQELTNFPVLVRLSNNSPSGFSYADFYNPGDVPGADLCFLDAAGNGIPHEIDTWDPNGESLVWVTLPRMVNGTEFSMWYRSSKNGSVVCAGNAWENYTGVWHLGEGGDGVQSVYDSTTNALTGVTHANSSAQAAGRVGGSRRVSTKGGASDANGRILVSLSDAGKRAAVDALAATGSDKTFTASAWLRPRGGTDYAYFIGRKTDDKYGAWGAQFNSNSENKNGSFKPIRVYSAGTADSQSASVDVDATASGVWRKIDIVWTKTSYTIYYDGGTRKWTGALNSSNGQEPVNGSSDLSFGGTTSSGYGSMNAELDEVRLRCGNMGDDWVKADYDTVNNLSFLNGGAVVALAETPKPIATLALSDTGAKYAQFSGSIGNCGGEATECIIYAKVWETADSEPVAWTLLASGLEAGGAFSQAVTGLDPETAYSYKIKAVNNLETPVDSEIAEGTFTTGGTGSAGTGGERYRVGNDYVHVFEVDSETGENAFAFTPPDYVSAIQTLVVAGGGAGGYRRGGGGGAGGLIYDAALAVSGGATYAINVGTGGVASASAAAYGSNGGDSSITGTGVNVAAAGGGAGGNGPSNGAGVAGGSGGGAGSGSTAAGAGTAGQGNAGGIRGYNGNYSAGGGGGGAGRPGSDGSLDSPPAGGSGGQGFLTDISGTPTWYAGGGGGGGQQGGTSGNLGNPGGGGDGGGGRGGMAVPSGTVNPSFSPAAAAGQNGLGGGGGGGSDVSGFYEGGNGGNGIVIVRYTVQGTGAGSAEPVVSLTGAAYAGDLKITGTYRVAWAGEGEDMADVFIKWGYSANSLTHTVLVAQDAIGTGSFEITVPVDQTTIYLRAMADNGTAEGLSDEIVAIYVPEYDGVVPGDTTIPVFGAVSLSEIDGIFARVSGTVTSFGTAGAGEDPITNCVVYALVGTSDNVSRMTAHQETYVTAGEPFSYAIDGLTPGTTYYWCLEARNSAGVAVASTVGSFTTLPEHTVANVVSASNSQRTVALSGSLAQVGAGMTTVSVRWREGGDAWGDWTTLGTFDGTSASTAFNASHASESWNTTIYWEASFSNQCVTAAGEPAGEPWVTTQSGNFATGDKATYTWQAVDGDWDGSWTNAAHWACNQADRHDYPDGGKSTVVFNNNTVATIEVPGSYAIDSCSMAKTGIDLTFVGEDAATSRLSGNFGGGGNLSNSSWTFSAITLAESNGIEFGNTSTVNASLVLKDRASATMGSGGLNLIGSNVWLVVEGGSSFGSRVGNCTKDGGIRLDDGTVSGTFFRTDYNWTATTNEWYVFSGAAPRLTATTAFRNDSANEAHLQNADTTFLFSVPARGWSAAPLYAEYSSSEKFGGMLGTGEGGYVITVDPDSPAISAAGKHKAQLVAWRSGIDIDHVRLAEPPEGVTISLTYGWPSTLDEPENEGDAPTGVKALIIGPPPPTVIILQ